MPEEDQDAPGSPFRLGGLVSEHAPVPASKAGFGFWVSTAYSLNYIMGTGFLTLPFAASQAGVVLSLVALFTMAGLANTAKDFVLETCARAELIENPDCFVAGDGRVGGAITPALIRQINSSQDLPLLLTVKKRKYEMPTLCQLFLGAEGKGLYMIFLSVYIYGALLAYSTVFANSTAAMFPLPSHVDSYAVYLCLFAVLVLPLSCLELTEQVSVQIVMALCRVLMVVCMVGTVAAAYTEGGADSFPGQSAPEGIPLWDWKGLPVFLPIAWYSFIYHHSIAGLSHPVRDKTLLGQIFLATFVICSVSYGVIAGTFALTHPYAIRLLRLLLLFSPPTYPCPSAGGLLFWARHGTKLQPGVGRLRAQWIFQGGGHVRPALPRPGRGKYVRISHVGVDCIELAALPFWEGSAAIPKLA